MSSFLLSGSFDWGKYWSKSACLRLRDLAFKGEVEPMRDMESSERRGLWDDALIWSCGVNDFSNSFWSMVSNCWIKLSGLERFDQILELRSGAVGCGATGWGLEAESVRLLRRLVLAMASSRGLLFCRWCLVRCVLGAGDDELSSLYNDFWITSRSLWSSSSWRANLELRLVMLSLISTMHISFKASKRIWSSMSIDTSRSIWGRGTSYLRSSDVFGNSVNSCSGSRWGETAECVRRCVPGTDPEGAGIFWGVVMGETAMLRLIPFDLMEFWRVTGLDADPAPLATLNLDSNGPGLFSGVPTFNDNFCISGDNMSSFMSNCL